MTAKQPLAYGTVVGRFLVATADGTGAAMPATGTITFTPSAESISALVADPSPATVLQAPIVGALDAEGYLTVQATGARGVPLLATDSAATNPVGFQYIVSFANVSYAGTAVTMSEFPIDVPAGKTVDLSLVAPLPIKPDTVIVRDEAAAKAAQAAAEAAADRAEKAAAENRAPRWFTGSSFTDVTGDAIVGDLFISDQSAEHPGWTFQLGTEGWSFVADLSFGAAVAPPVESAPDPEPDQSGTDPTPGSDEADPTTTTE